MENGYHEAYNYFRPTQPIHASDEALVQALLVAHESFQDVETFEEWLQSGEIQRPWAEFKRDYLDDNLHVDKLMDFDDDNNATFAGNQRRILAIILSGSVNGRVIPRESKRSWDFYFHCARFSVRAKRLASRPNYESLWAGADLTDTELWNLKLLIILGLLIMRERNRYPESHFPDDRLEVLTLMMRDVDPTQPRGQDLTSNGPDNTRRTTSSNGSLD
ncbi:hypothetical protein B0T25DRAFT_571541 [Lasiosphaeria hispida]|uniref:Uncharacterized protein n=1 Tax=Lasiosphaeria hispida TaxID=260671 RepID=A0AAJ0HB77_9PEZI|nr:hypothetical protein B0T25DRAFT_571541 [Lasiosphaeria hispida]